MMSVILAILLILAAFYVLAVLTEEFFVPAIDKIAHKLRLSSDASGATLLAMGSSAPEFFIALFAVLGLIGGAHADVGAGTIVGSAIFNVLVIAGASALYGAVKLQWQPVVRDLTFYSITILMLLAAFWDGEIVWFEALGFVLMYGVYIFITVKWRSWLKYEDVPAPDISAAKQRNALAAMTHRVISIIVPDPERKPRWYLLTFFLSVAAIAAISWLLVGQVVVVAEALHINPTFLALTVLAAGTSIPDLIGSLVVAKQGRGDMAVSNAVGSNVFDILFALGMPWLIALLFMGKDHIEVGTENLSASVFLLFATVVAMLFLLVMRKWHLGRRSGLVLIGLYVAYCAYIAFTVS
jgi:K+-dependent Na+/Ca+ exchanger-like protein